MPIAKLNNVELAYVDEGEGDLVLLVHGFASSKEANWIDTGWVRLLRDSGRRVIAFDNRGHGDSTKFHSASDYSLDKMADDTLELMAHLGIEKPDIMGYSMGARITAKLAVRGGKNFKKMVFAGNGMLMIEGSGDWTAVRDALLAPALSDVKDMRGRAFRKFADQTKSDRVALAECVTAVRELFVESDFAAIRNEVLVVIGTLDDIAGGGQQLADLIPNGRFLAVPDRDHMRTVGDPVYKQGVLDFLAT